MAIAYAVSMDPRPSRRADYGSGDRQERRWRVSMDPRPSRRADTVPCRKVLGAVASQWILGRVVALTIVARERVTMIE